MMSSDTNILPRISPGTTPKPRFLDGLARRSLFSRLDAIHDGEIIIIDGDEQVRFGKTTTLCPFSATLHVKHPRFYSDVAFGGSIGAGEAYMAGYWNCNDLATLVRIMACNLDVVDFMEGGLARLTSPLQKLVHWFNRNSHEGSRRNIAAHYDLGNEFYRLMLDETMMYSSAIFADENMTLHAAQLHRLDIMCRKLDLKPTDHLLEIGTGWGGLALHAAQHYGCCVTTTTISREQYELACNRVMDAGLQDRVTVLMEDYRHLTGQFDKLISIEMIEAIGHEYYATYFRQCATLLKPQGMMLIQAITMADQRFEQAKRSVDFIQRYIFPGGCLPSVSVMLDKITRHSDMRLYHMEDIGPHYATTLRKWRDNVKTNLSHIRALGFSDTFLRMWDYYLCYCEGGFMERSIGTVQMLLVKPECRRDPV
ncbi:MAG TPA: cyclopropane-fatty-acyl-phospholipid synthase family protein [Gammaproteobacteria bacterium]|nr:cyclopropane-fatty-acyl-phospholipid synthase family protein [Gammaproteobacteria bacterium]